MDIQHRESTRFHPSVLFGLSEHCSRKVCKHQDTRAEPEDARWSHRLWVPTPCCAVVISSPRQGRF